MPPSCIPSLVFCCFLVTATALAAAPEYLEISEDDPFKIRKEWINSYVHSPNDDRDIVNKWYRNHYLNQLSEPILQPDPVDLKFPETFYLNEDYARALHTSYLVWAMSRANRPIGVPVRDWLEIVIDKGKVVPQNDNYIISGSEIALLLLETQLRLERYVAPAMPYYLDYLDRMEVYSPRMFELVWDGLTSNSEVLAESPALGVLYTNVGVLEPPYSISELSIPPQEFIQKLPPDHRYWQSEPKIQAAYLAWVRNDLPEDSLEGFVVPFPDHFETPRDMVRAWHWAYFLQALAEVDRPMDTQLLSWIASVLPKASPVPLEDSPKGRDERRETSKRIALASSLIKTWLISQPSQSDAMEQLLSTMASEELLPLPYSNEVKELWREILSPSGVMNDPMAAFHLFDQIDQIVGDDPEHFIVLMGQLHTKIAWAKWDISRSWPERAHSKLVSISENEGTYRSSSGLSAREYAWMMRRSGYDDEMSREEALSMRYTRTHTLIDIYEERYVLAWWSVWGAALLFFLVTSTHRVMAAVLTTVALTLLIPAIIYVMAVLSSIGHNYANYGGYLSVLQGFFPFYGSLVAIFWIVTLARIGLRLSKKNQPVQ